MPWIHAETYYLGVTIFAELLILILASQLGRLGLGRIFFGAVVAANLISHPLAWAGYYRLVELFPLERWWIFGSVETTVVLFEALIYVQVARLKIKPALILSALANGGTTVLGFWL